ncbi:hypothetical protein KP509_27G053400 [Ceratopteris richardii]|nr:hypothetical protein KP509_27G053400 [Ceratopteris richardii]
MVVGYIFLSTEAILVHRGMHGTKSNKKAIHFTIQGVAFWMAALGIWTALLFHKTIGISNFYSLHSWFGILTVFLFGIQWICSYMIYWYPGASAKTRAAVLPWHTSIGLLVHCTALLTAEMGLLEKLTFLMVNKVIGRFSFEAVFVNSVGLLLLVHGGLVILACVLPRSS